MNEKSSYLHLLVLNSTCTMKNLVYFHTTSRFWLAIPMKKFTPSDKTCIQSCRSYFYNLNDFPFLFDTGYIFYIVLLNIYLYGLLHAFEWNITNIFFFLWKINAVHIKVKKIRNKLIRIGVNLSQECKMNFKNLKYNWQRNIFSYVWH